MAAPADIHIGQVVLGLPVFGVKYRIYAGAVGTGRITENAERCVSPGVIGIHALIFHELRIFFHMFSYEIVLIGLIQGSCQKHRLIHELCQLGQGVPEKAADTAGHIDSGSLQFGERNGFQSGNLEAPLLPYRTDTQHVEEFCNILAGGTHIGAGPENHADIFRILALVCNEFFNHPIPQFHPQLPAGRRWQGSGIHAVEIAS